ncbi:MAG: Ig-like domain repeat protein [Anaerolineales bacterium]
MDTTAPTLDLSTTGTTGQNGWYVSAVTLTPKASDATSGLYSLEATTDGVTWTNVSTPITLPDGIYTVQFRATDNAGNVSQTPARQIYVDATTPGLSLNINGTRGQNDWYISSVTVTPNVSDGGSGINKVEASVNNGAWGTITSPLSFTDGVHSYKIRATDNAGNVTETPVLPMMMDTVPPAIATYDDTLDLGDTFNYDLEDTLSGLWINRSVIEDDAEKYKKIVWLEELTGNKSNDNTIRWDGIFADGTKAAPGQYFITLKISDQAGNETMRTAIVEVTAFNSILPIPAFTPPASTVTEPIPSEASTTNEQSFGGANNGNVGTETTTINGETVFASVNLQAGGTNSFTSGNQTTNLPNTNPNILWGAAAAAMLGATLAEWQKKREEDAARLAALIASNAGQGDEDEIPPDVLAKRRGKVIAKNQAKRAQEQVWEAARTQQQTQQAANIAKAVQADMTQEEKLSAYKQTAGYIARQESYAEYESQKSLEAQRAGERDAVAIADAYKAQEQARQNAVDAARWAGVASVALGKQESEEKNTGGKALAMPARDDDPPNWWEKYVVQPLKNAWNTISSWFTQEPITRPTPTPAVLPTQPQFPTVVFTPTISVSPTVTPTPTQSKIYNIDGPMTVDQIPPEFICTLPEWKNINGQDLRNLYYDRCKIGEQLMVALLTDPNGWWWEDSKTKWDNKGNIIITEWKGVKTNEDFWRLALAYGLDTEGAELRFYNTNGYGPLIEEAIINKFWHFDSSVKAQYGKPDASSGIYDPNDSSPLGTNGRLVALGSLQSLEMRNNVLLPPMDGGSTNMWQYSWNRYPDLFANEPEPGWKPLPNAPYEVGNIDQDHYYYKSENVEEGTGKFEVLYRSSPTPASVRAIVLTFEQFAVYSQYPK